MTIGRLLRLVLAGGVAAVTVASVRAATPDDDVTITVVDEGATPNDVVKVIELPERGPASAASNHGRADAAAGNDKSDAARTGNDRPDRDLNVGQQISEDARSAANDQARGEAAQHARNDARNDEAGGANRHKPPH